MPSCTLCWKEFENVAGSETPSVVLDDTVQYFCDDHCYNLYQRLQELQRELHQKREADKMEILVSGLDVLRGILDAFPAMDRNDLDRLVQIWKQIDECLYLTRQKTANKHIGTFLF